MIAANLSAALGVSGRQVLQVGCDPKHDSTRLLLRGRRLTTVLDYLRATPPLERRVEDVLATGFAGVGCVEAGGPQPGVGCAGRGIISTFTLLDGFKLDERYDMAVYDVLGDVVCGGFAVPIRREYADVVFVVTSGEFMALYAANNILRGVRNYDAEGGRLAGLVHNRRDVAGEDERVARFARAVGLPVVAVVPRSDAFTRAEQARMTLIEAGESPEIVAVFARLAAALQSEQTLFRARPLEDDELEQVVLQGGLAPARRRTPAGVAPAVLGSEAGPPGAAPATLDSEADPPGAAPAVPGSEAGPPGAARPGVAAPVGLANPNRYLSKDIVRGEPLHGCAFNGAMCAAAYLRDVVVLAHSPRSCAYLTYQTITSTGRRRLFERGSLLPAALTPDVECTEMGEPEVVFGGLDKLLDKVRLLKRRRPKAIVVVSSCPAGITGDDIERVRELSEPGLPVIPLPADGNMNGDYLQGAFDACISLAREFIERDVPTVPDTVNIVGEKIVVTNVEDNFSLIADLLARLGIKVGCRFLCNTSFDALRDFNAAPLNLAAHSDYTTMTLQRFFTEEYGARFLDQALPVGFGQCAAWLRGLGEFFSRQAQAEQIIAESRADYDAGVARLRPALAGKRLMVITYNHELDWILETALDVGMEIVKVGVLDYSQDEGFRTKLDGPLPVEENYDRARRAADIAALRPDVLLSNYASSVADRVPVADTIPMCPDLGFDSGLKLAARWETLLRLDTRGDWRDDARLFERHHP
jgi:nitrogenase iron protein